MAGAGKKREFCDNEYFKGSRIFYIKRLDF